MLQGKTMLTSEQEGQIRQGWGGWEAQELYDFTRKNVMNVGCWVHKIEPDRSALDDVSICWIEGIDRRSARCTVLYNGGRQ